jgi:hypothetical protein
MHSAPPRHDRRGPLAKTSEGPCVTLTCHGGSLSRRVNLMFGGQLCQFDGRNFRGPPKCGHNMPKRGLRRVCGTFG